MLVVSKATLMDYDDWDTFFVDDKNDKGKE
jgi:hypothetical protein